MKNVIIMRGLPGSGKTTKAKEMKKELVADNGEVFRINRDLLRKMLHFNEWTPKNEGVTVDMANTIVRGLLARPDSGKKRTVIIDDTNLTDRHLAQWTTIAKEGGATTTVIDIDTPVDTCIIRDAQRPDDERVGTLKIMQIAMGCGRIPADTKFIVSDMDGTLADCTHRLHFVKKGEGEPKDWKSFFANVSYDTPRLEVYDQVMKDFLNAVQEYGVEKVKFIIVSARPERCRKDTEEWLEQHGMMHDVSAILMRGDNDSRQDDIVKREIYEKYLKPYEVLRVYDDRPRVLRVWEELGIDTVDVGPGIEF